MASTARSADVVVVGARCAGAATAMLLARQGHRVVLVDRACFPSDTLSTHALSRGGVVQLARWGLLDEVADSGAPAIRQKRYSTGAEPTDRPITPRAGVDALYAPRRTVLDTILVRAAVAAGAELREGLTVVGPTWADGRVTGVLTRDRQGHHGELGATVVVGADGVRSRMARAVRAPFLDRRPALGATHYALVAGLQDHRFEFHIGPDVFAGIFPTNDGLANVWACTPAARTDLGRDRGAGLEALLGRANPQLLADVRAGTRTSPVRGAVGLPNHIRRSWGPGWALVGDAGMHRDPITGHGMTDAFRDAELLAEALHGVLTGTVSEQEADAAYHDQRHQLAAAVFETTVALTRFPEPTAFFDLQVAAARAMEDEAGLLAARPPIAVVTVAA